ncbi:MAG: gamma-glutamyltransferase [Pseudomonadota bacterium]|nr:gamma-glutamyltransferase [Pseudomonadota bacterium]
MQNKKLRQFILLFSILLLFFSTLSNANGRIAVRGENGAVASSSLTASKVGVEILKDGGNAIDAAIATAFAMAVTHPTAGNIGGGGFLIYHGANGESTAFDFREKAPLSSTSDMYLDDEGNVKNNDIGPINHFSIKAVGVPGTVAGLALAHDRLGSLDWSKLVSPSVQLARQGIPITWKLYDDFNSPRRKAWFNQYPSSMEKFYKSDGSAYLSGDNWIQNDLADTLERIQDKGKDGFYKGKTAQLIADFMLTNNGLITLEDLEKYQAVERKPIKNDYRGYTIVSMPPPSSGGIILSEMLNILEGFNLNEIGHNSAQYLHLLTESMRRAYADRANYLGDPDFNEDMPLKKLQSKEHAANLRSTINMRNKSESDPSLFAQPYESEETTHFSVVDKDGNMVSLTYTLEFGYGSHIVVKDAGFLLNNEMGDFNAVPGVTNVSGRIGTIPNQIRPEQRMLSSMTPTIVAKNGVPLFATGTPGGKTIINTTMQTILNIVDHGMTIAESIEAPRIHHQWLPDVTTFEKLGISPDTKKEYESYGHKIRVRNTIGSAMGVYRDPETGIISGAADSRAEDGGAAAY